MIYRLLIISGLFLFTFQFCGQSENVSGEESQYFPPKTSITFPRLFGMQIGSKHYHDSTYIKNISKLDVAIMGFYKGWSKGNMDMRQVLDSIRSLNPDIILGQYTILNETGNKPEDIASRDVLDMVNESNWWLLNAQGEKVQWTVAYDAWNINISSWVTPDNNGHFYSEWIAKRDYEVYFRDTPQFSIWYFDNVFIKPRVDADWDLDGENDDPLSKSVINALQDAHVREWQVAKQLRSDIYLAGNTDHDISSDYYKNKLNGAFLESQMGKPTSIETQRGWKAMMDRYHNAMINTIHPNLVGFNVWGNPEDYKFFRYALCSSLMNDGYFSFTDEEVGYSNVSWFDEYDVALGLPVEPPVKKPWINEVFKREFTNGLVMVNPNSQSISVKLDKLYHKINGKQDSLVNDGSGVTQIELPGKDGIILLKNAP